VKERESANSVSYVQLFLCKGTTNMLKIVRVAATIHIYVYVMYDVC
jgi:hypothetical protein